MNKVIAGGLMMAGILTGCAKSGAAPLKPVETAKDRVAVVYFSWSPDGNTRFAAQTIAAKAGASLTPAWVSSAPEAVTSSRSPGILTTLATISWIRES